MAQVVYLASEELRKLMSGSKLKVLLLLSFLVGVLFVWISARIGLSGNLPADALELLLIIVLPLFMVSLGSELMVSEFKAGTFKNALKLPLSRETLFIGKILAGWLAGALIVLSAFVPTFIGGIMLQGMPALSTLGMTIAEVGGAILFCGLLVVLANSVALWTGSSGVGQLVSIVLWLAMGVLGWFDPQLKRFFITDFADWVQPLLYRGDMGATATTLLFLTSYYIMGTITGWLAFQRKEI